MAVGVLKGENVIACGEGVEVGLVFQVALGHVAVERLAAALIGEKQIFRQGVGFVPGIRSILVRTSALFKS